jgi:hypothetical protein
MRTGSPDTAATWAALTRSSGIARWPRGTSSPETACPLL